MIQIHGKTLVTTDWHIGLKQNSKLRLSIVVKVVKHLLSHIKENGIQNLIFCGDLFHERVAVNVNSLNVALKCIQSIAKSCNVYLIVGNHDSHMKNSIDINSMNIFHDTPNVHIISNCTQVSINGNNSLFVPWLGDVTSYGVEQFDMVFGHFELSKQYLIRSYIQGHSQNKLTNILSADVNDLLKDNTESTSNIGDLAGNFVDVVKKSGTVFSGHIHGHKEFISKGRKFILVGDPYQQNLGEKENSCGFYVINNDNSYKFHEINDVPKHIDLRLSEIVNDIDNFDFSVVKGNIVHKIYDVEVNVAIDATINQKINDWQPFEELLPDYDVEINSLTDSATQLQDVESIDLIKRSKMEYVKNYISKIDKKVLADQDIDPDKLYDIIDEHYNKVIEEK